jgi:hypothetical protein
MSWLDAVSLALIHRETYVAILASWVPHGEKGSFARRVGITQEYLSYLCALDHPARGKYPTKRLPSPQLAKKIAEAIPAPKEVKQSLLENMELAQVNAARAHYAAKEFLAERRAAELLAEIERFHRSATFGADRREVRRAYRAVRDGAAALIPFLPPEDYPASLAQACLYLHDAQCVLDRADDALRYAKLARLVLGESDRFEPGFNREQFDYLEINAVRGEGVALHNLGLDGEAQNYYTLARATPAYRNARDFWGPLVGRDMLNAMVQIPRFGYREAQRLAHGSIDLCERRNDEFTLFLVRESWLRCLIQREKWKRAQQVYHEEFERIPILPYVGALHLVLFYKTGADLAWRLKDLKTWTKRAGEALALMHQAGLSHQIRLLEQQYGRALGPVLEALNLTLPST